MKTKDFIAMLQKEDPTGEGYIRMYGGIPRYAMAKEGYYDGPYNYIDKEGNYVTSIKGYKVDIYCEDITDFIEKHFEEGWKEIEKKFKFEFNGYVNGAPDRKSEILKRAKKEYDEYKEAYDEIDEKDKQEMITNADKGWKWFQNKEIDGKEPMMHYYYTWLIFDEQDKEKGSNVHMTKCVQKSGLWERLDNNVKPGYYQWIYKR